MSKLFDLHQPVLLKESIEALKLTSSSVVVDATLGLGGHSSVILENIKDGSLIAIDQDQKHLDIAKQNLAKFTATKYFVKDNFANMDQIVSELNYQYVDAILLDLGIASLHVDDPKRGFSYHYDGPLDMRLDQDTETTAADVVNFESEDELTRIFLQYGEERYARKIAREICKERKIKKFETTQELTTLITNLLRNQKKHPAKKVFQALRIHVNRELEVLEKVLRTAVGLLSSGGRLAVISYHSLEDRIVKQFIKSQARQCICPKELPLCTCNFQPQLKIINKKPIIPDSQEVESNNRSRSAKLRIAERTSNKLII